MTAATDTAGPVTADTPGATNTSPTWAGVAAVAVAACTAVVTGLWGEALLRDGVGVFLGAPPFVGEWELLWSPVLWWAVALAVALVWFWVPATTTLAWGWVLSMSWIAALVWPALLQLAGGWESLYTVLGNRRAYLPTARAIDSPSDFLATFVERVPDYPTHVKGHPPGATLAHWLVDTLGGGRSDVLTATFLVIAASAAPAALVALDRVAGRAAARRAAAFVGLAPAAIWVASSPDAMFAGVMAWSVALGAIAVTSQHRAQTVAAGAGAGLLAGVCLTLSYGFVLLLGPLWALAVLGLRTRRWEPLAAAAVAAAVVPGMFAIAGFNWLDGLAATREAYLAGVAPGRPDRYFVVSNLAVTAVSVGPAAVASLVWLRDRRAWWLVGGAVFAVVAADLSTMSKGEVERIWLPAVPFLVCATCTLGGLRTRRMWLAIQLAVAFGLNLVLRSPW